MLRFCRRRIPQLAAHPAGYWRSAGQVPNGRPLLQGPEGGIPPLAPAFQIVEGIAEVNDALCAVKYYLRCSARLTTPLAPFASGLERNVAQSAMSRRRFSNKSPRRYAASTLLPIVCANAASQTSFG